MRNAIGVIAAGAILPALLWSADPGRCRLDRNLYDDRLALVQRQGQAGGAATDALLAPGVTAPANKLAAIDNQYRQFLTELSAASANKDADAIKSCCGQASGDRAGGLLCQLVQYVSGGRVDNAAFVDLFPSSRRDTILLWDLDSIAGGPSPALYPPKGPSYRLIDELFLLVMDQRDTATTKYFNLATHASGDAAKYIDAQIATFLKEAPSAVVNQWLVLRRFRPKLKTAAQQIIAVTPPAEMQNLVKTVRAFCDKANPDCPDILKLYAGK
jgi:hypothetical protein